MLSLHESLCKIVDADRVLTRLIDRLTYASDAGFYQLVPKAIVQPETVEEVKDILALSADLKMPVVFRAGGTSLSGQSITDGILVDLGRHWRKVEVLAGAAQVKVQPGITGAMVNHVLKKYGRKIGPDPASINAAMMGGIISNNASGMCCGVVNNSYHTLHSVRFVLPNGMEYNTAESDDYNLFLKEQPALAATLIALRQQLLVNPALTEKIRRKYRTKNTVGYSLNALLDFDHPLDIIAHLLPGAEGTLAFIAEATLLTLPDLPCKSAAMLYFPTIADACAAIVALRETGVEALELMDRASLRSVEHLPGLPAYFKELPDGCAALLAEYQTETMEGLAQKIDAARPLLTTLGLLQPAEFTSHEKDRMFYWKLRKGLFPSVGAVRARGTTVILEDIAFPVERLAEGVLDIQTLFVEFGYDNAIIFGHAKDGNIHFVITQLLDTPEEVSRYDRFMRKVAGLVVEKYDGALKAEHGTGRNMAPFVEAEWGGEAYAIMKTLKEAVDPQNLLNPGVIINDDPEAHLRHLKDLPQVEEVVDKCIECGFCEPSCPSRDLTMTPRRRIVARRALQRMQKQGDAKGVATLLSEYQFDGLDTCATDGLCASECPVSINTGELVKHLRHEQHGKMAIAISKKMASNYALMERLAKFGIAAGHAIDMAPGIKLLGGISKGLRSILPWMPVWLSEVKGSDRLPVQPQDAPDYIYFTACINRMMSNKVAGKKSLQQTMIDVSARAGIQLVIPSNIRGHCCGQPFSSKGYFEAGHIVEEKTIDALMEWSHNGDIPVVCDFTSCTYTFIQNAAHLSKAYRDKFARLRWIDSVAFLNDEVLPKLKISKKVGSIGIHPTCAITKLQLQDALMSIASACAGVVVKPAYAGCCGMAGDRGFLVPELTAKATALEIEELHKAGVQQAYASATTCEIALENAFGKPFEHIVYLLEESSR